MAAPRQCISGPGIAQIAKMIGRELDTGAGPSEEALAAGPILAEAGATTDIIASLLAEVHRKRPNDRLIAGYTFILEGALGTLRLQSSGGDIEADRAIAEVRHRLDDAVQKGGTAPEVLMLMARSFARAELDPGRTLQQAMMTAIEAQSRWGAETDARWPPTCNRCGRPRCRAASSATSLVTNERAPQSAPLHLILTG